MTGIKKSKETIRESVLVCLNRADKRFSIRSQKIILSIYDATPKFVIETLYDIYKRINIFRYNRSVKYNLEDIPLFRAVEIETINRCNGKCPFCPVNIHSDPRPYAKMDDALFKKIIDELHTLNYSGVIGLYSNNEPFLDERMPDMLRYTKEKLPNAGLYLFTNGSLLTLDKFIKCIDYLDYLIIDNYNDKHELNPNPKKIHEYCQSHPELFEKVNFSMRLLNEILTNRGGQAPNKTYSEIAKYNKVKCLLPFGQLIIRPDGKISLCCNDALGKYTLGDVTSDKLVDIWYSEAYMKVREEILSNGRKNLKLCKDCDTIHTLHFGWKKH